MKIILNILVVFVALFSGCKNYEQKVTLTKVKHDTTISLYDNNSLFEQWVEVDVTGKIDGKAIIEMQHTIIESNKLEQTTTTGYYVD